MSRAPIVARWILARSLHPGERDVVLGDFDEEYLQRSIASGALAARRWYRHQVVVSLVPNLRRRLARPRPAPARRDGGFVDGLTQDISYAWRMIRRRPVVSFVALVSLTTGVLLPSVVFSLLNAAVLRPLPVTDPNALAVVLEVRSTGLNHNFPFPDFVDYRAGQRGFVDMMAVSRGQVSVRRGDGVQVLPAEFVSGSYFDVLGVRMRQGRGLAERDDSAAAAAVAVVSEALWQQLTGGIESTETPPSIEINKHRFDVVGVVAAPFRGTEVGGDSQVWLPIAAQFQLDADSAPLRTSRTASWLTLMGRLKPGSSFEDAREDLNRIEIALAAPVGRPRRSLTVVSGRQGDSMLPGTVRTPLVLLLGAALLVLLVACANVANLLIGRATERARELAVRSALGAGCGRLARLALIEAVLLASAGAGVALAAAPALVRQVVPFLGRYGEPVALDPGVDWRVLSFVTALAVIVTLLAGLAPALASLRGPSLRMLGENNRAVSGGHGVTRLRSGLVVVQFAFALSLVVVSVLLTRTVYNLQTQPTGLDIDHVALLAVEPDAAQYDQTRTANYLATAIARLQAVPGVRAAGYSRVAPLAFGGSRMTVLVPGYSAAADEDMELDFNRVTPGYADAIGLQLVSGRWITAHDTAASQPVTVINETMARRYWKDAAVGRRIRFGNDDPDVEIVGVVRDVKYRMLRDAGLPSFYLPLAQMPAPSGIIVVRTAGSPRPALGELRSALSSVDPAVPIGMVRTLREQASINLSDERLAMLIATVLGGAALVLAAFGLYASMSHVVGQRVREIGIRVALGATHNGIRRLVLGEATVLAFCGTAGGVVLAMVFGRLIETRLYGVTPTDWPTLVASAAGLGAIALFASDVPARRAARIDPINALREE